MYKYAYMLTIMHTCTYQHLQVHQGSVLRNTKFGLKWPEKLDSFAAAVA